MSPTKRKRWLDGVPSDEVLVLLALVVRLGLDGVSSGVVVVELLAEVVLPLVDLGVLAALD